MRDLLIKLFIRLMEPKFMSTRVDEKRMNKWLAELNLSTSGFQDWYTLRKRALLEDISSLLTKDQYLIKLGQLQELKHLAGAARINIKKYDKTSGRLRSNKT